MLKKPQVIEIFDRFLVRERRNRAAARFSAHDFLFTWTIENLADRLQDIKRDFARALLIGARGRELSEGALRRHGPAEEIFIMEAGENFLKPGASEIIAEEEYLPFANDSFDLVFSPLTLHSVNDLPGALIQINRVLRPDGLFLGAMLGGETLYQLRQAMMQAEINIAGGASPHVAPFADKQQTGALLQRAGFALPVVDSEILTVTYEDAFRLMHDLRGMGEASSLRDRRRKPYGKALFMETARLYHERFAEPDGRLVASFEVIFMIGWAPHTSQQKPLRPGSARQRLSDALGAEEIKTGIKPGDPEN